MGATCNRPVTRVREKAPKGFVQMRTISIGHIQGGIADEAWPSGRRFYSVFNAATPPAPPPASPASAVPFPPAQTQPAAAAGLALLPGASWTGPCCEDGMVRGGGL